MSDQSKLNVQYSTGGVAMTNCFLVEDASNGEGGAWMIVDPIENCHMHFREEIEKRDAPAAIVVTHGHFDHCDGLAKLREVFPDVPVYGTELTGQMVASPMYSGAELFGVPFEPSSITDVMEPGETFKLGSFSFDIVDTPGHCPGSISLIGEGHAITGDVIFKDSIGRYDLPGGDLDTLARVIREKIMTLPDDTIIWPGHGPETTIGTERSSNPMVRQILGAA